MMEVGKMLAWRLAAVAILFNSMLSRLALEEGR